MITMHLALAAAVASVSAQYPTGPQPVGGKIRISPEYPTEAIWLGQQGRAEATLIVGADGIVRDCLIAQSSGSPVLDAETCNSLRQVRFTPARDASGRSVQSTFSQAIYWRLQGNEVPFAPWSFRYMVAVDAKGQQTYCSVQAGGALARKHTSYATSCDYFRGAFEIPAQLASQYLGRKATFIFDEQFAPRVFKSIDTPRDLRKYPLLTRQVLHLKVDASGMVRTCRRSSAEGPYTPAKNGCDIVRSREFRPNAKFGKGAWATATTAIYVFAR